jgi:hypothetical protein
MTRRLRRMALARTINKAAFFASAILAAVAFAKRDQLPAPHTLSSELAAEPKQRITAKEPFTAEYAGVLYAVAPEFVYELHGMVVSYRQHDGKSRMHRAANDHLNVADLCVVWGDTAVSPYLNDVSFWNGIFTCNFETRSQEAWESIDAAEIANNHLISDDARLRDEIARVSIGDEIRMRGWLASYGTGGNKRGTSTTRNDTGDGACETIFVQEFRITRRSQNPWRSVLYAALGILAVTVVVHFRLPYRPYG